ncbi:MAG TPA: hypothetical protein VEF03_11490 [Candidatus Binataceae bacterium]|nr:hypothetical protein [Candidatus Binataceae bacterium]
MIDSAESLLLDLLEWIANRDRSYEDVMAAWRTSCPRFPIWENAKDRGLVITNNIDGRSIVKLTASGLILLRDSRRVQGL